MGPSLTVSWQVALLGPDTVAAQVKRRRKNDHWIHKTSIITILYGQNLILTNFLYHHLFMIIILSTSDLLAPTGALIVIVLDEPTCLSDSQTRMASMLRLEK